jgi:hypothetical protein
MPRYLFSTQNTPPVSDEADVELPDDAAAILEAALIEADLTRNGPRVRIKVWDENGRLLNK